MSARFSFSMNRFGPTRAEEISGVSRTTQRDWRREGHLPTSEGMARYDLFDLCELWVLKSCADVGLGPKRAKVFSRSAALHMAWHCLRLIGSYEGDHLTAPASKHNKTFDLGGQTFDTPAWGRKARWLADHIMYDKDDPNPCSEFYGIWPDGEAMPMDNFHSMFMPADRAVAKRGAVIVLPLNLAANWLVEAANEPLVQVTFEKGG